MIEYISKKLRKITSRKAGKIERYKSSIMQSDQHQQSGTPLIPLSSSLSVQIPTPLVYQVTTPNTSTGNSIQQQQLQSHILHSSNTGGMDTMADSIVQQHHSSLSIPSFMKPDVSTLSSELQLNEGEHIDSQGQLIGRSGKPLRNTKRAAQNRNAQKAFRQRRERYIKDLETKAKEFDKLSTEVVLLKQENEMLRLRIKDLEK